MQKMGAPQHFDGFGELLRRWREIILRLTVPIRMEMAVKHHLPKGVRLVAAAGVSAPEAVICTPPTVKMRNMVSKMFTPL